MSISFSEIKGLPKLLAQAKQAETVNREDAWLSTTYVVAGERIRTMAVEDFTILLQFNSPILSRRLPTPGELVFFIWSLTPECLRLREKRVPEFWRRWRTNRFGRGVRKRMDIAGFEAAKLEAEANGEAYTLPDNHPFAGAIQQAFKYIDLVFMDKPPGLSRNGVDSGLCYLTAWFDAMQSEYHLPTEEIWKMELPVLFARMKAMQYRKLKQVPGFNAQQDKVLRKIMDGLRDKQFTEDDLREGRVDLAQYCPN